MKTPSILLLAGALVVAGGAALLARALLATPPKPPVVQQVVAPVVEPEPKQAVLVASRNIKPGEFIDTASVEWQTTEHTYSPRQYFLREQDTIDVLLGATVRQPIAKGQPLINNLVVRPGEPGFVAAVLKPGMRAVAVPTNAVASSSGLVSAGDRVDVILSLNLAAESKRSTGASDGLPKLASQTLLRNVRVLALNNVTRSDISLRESPADLALRKKQRRDTEFYETVTLEVPPSQAERLALAREIGTLQLALRGIAETSGDGPQPGSQSATTLRQATRIYDGFNPPIQAFRGAQLEMVKVN
ncbi:MULTISPECIES: Flp pilus assembly protein CpaB [Pseudomonas]|uniref:Flp pilus assembly protein CpaB n=1 Tax=Pseudomonas TaxID=286 RepID=UPI00216A2F6F|nr:Flp pilus assembly protein CpaB [Pseudomonas grimontii]MCS3514919.1 pilus assembly protein CpaB [Pseudomonas grimontii]